MMPLWTPTTPDSTAPLPDPEQFDLRFLGRTQIAGSEDVLPVYEVLDCLPEQEKKKRDHNSIRLHQAMQYFGLGHRQEAEELLREIASAGAGDHVTDLLYDYIRKLPEEEKDNVFRLVRK